MLDKENQEKLNRVRRNLAEMGSHPESSTYERAKGILKSLATETQKGKDAYVALLDNVIKKLDNLAESYANTGDSKVTAKFVAIRNKLMPLKNKIKSGNVKSIETIQTAADSALRDLIEVHPKGIDKFHEKAGIKDQSKAFAGFNKKRVKLAIDPKKGFELKKAPMLLVFKNKVTPIQKKVLESFGAHFYQGTNGVSIPEIPILVLNTKMTPKADWGKAAKSIFKMLGRPDLAAFIDLAVEKGDAVAIPVLEPKKAEVMSVVFFDATQSKELWIE